MGRNNFNLGFALISAVVTVLAGWFVITENLHASAEQTPSGGCPVIGQTHQAVIKNGTLTPTSITAKKCDKLTVTNKDGITRDIGFGNHDHHVPYDGVAERILAEGKSLTVTLNQIGKFHYHDHFHYEIAGSFTVQ